MVDDSALVLQLKAFETLLVCRVFDSFVDDDSIGHWYLVNNVPCDRSTTIEVHKFMTSLLVLFGTQVDRVKRSCNIRVRLR
jgi:hypothetical protein